jgi:phage terminase large subunit
VKRQRRQYSADWKAKVALEAIKGQRAKSRCYANLLRIITQIPSNPAFSTLRLRRWLE